MLRIYEVILEVIRELRPFLRRLEGVDADLANQMKRALPSVALNTAEGQFSRGKLRGLRFSTAAASASETRSCIDVGVALHDMQPPSMETLEKLRHVIGALTILSR
jgi:four helix bundle protein